MQKTGFTMRKEYAYDGLAALLLIKTEDKKGADVAEHVARMNEEEVMGAGHVVWGVRWAAVVRPDDSSETIPGVVANVKVKSQEALKMLIERIKGIDGVVNPTALTVDQYVVGLRGHNSLPY